ncbi:DUF2085 domain-containing protein [Halorhabdus rudnickae]|uniref:DUF2085 domain-containing protein n=1 Tax=Halorhabdus rudnickae TaxID=1775544 RepID=UPI001082D4B4|nr:DUF2085 domain-containing protein [Halorhabdus rudnickae]
MDLDVRALRRGLAEARPYLLSHHLPERRHRCYRLRPFGRRIDVCARCSGVYPGIVLGVLAFFLAPGPFASLLAVALLPFPALLDWSHTALGNYRGYNPVRTTTGALLGYGYGVGLGQLFLAGNLRVLAVGIVYVVLAGTLLVVQRRRSLG